ncbi:ribosome maturation factor RimM [Ponticaulis profundi]|uniref:Ribosome maturation factor RimM n=1 Tax=Ponticaulis profundi TaxID=2665222 RepID=A0ABW1SA68_9PROT
MTKQGNWVCVGAIAGAHGVRGDVRVRSFTQYPEDCFAYGPLCSETGEVLIDPIEAKPVKNAFVVKTETSKSREDWEAMKGTRLYVPREHLPPAEEDEFYYDDLLNLTVTHVDGRALGHVKAVQNFGADDLLEIVAPDGRTAYYLPFTKAVIPTLRLEAGELLADPEESYLPEDMQIADEPEADKDA